MKCGTVLFDKKYQFPNGTIGEKLSVVLCEYGTTFLVAKTTSQPHAKGRTIGCQSKDKPPNFFLPRNSSWFNSDTWIELDDVYELDGNIHNAKRRDSTTIEHHNVLPDELMRRILDCAIESEWIDEFDLEFLRRERARLEPKPEAIPATPKPD